jgi:sporulation protein YlmC with PRC-barrel domain
MFLSELLGSPVVSQSGRPVGRLLDIRIDQERASGIVVANHGLVRRLLHGRDASGRVAPLKALPWKDIVTLQPGSVVVSDSAARALDRHPA